MNIPHGSNPSTAAFTCNTCGIKFAGAELQRQHMKTEWHRYNLKRRVAELPSISSELFAEKVLIARENENNILNEDEFGFYVPQRRRHNSSGDGVQLSKKYLKRQERLHAKGSQVPKSNETDGQDDYASAEPVLGEFVGIRARGSSISASSVKSETSEFSIVTSHHESEMLFESSSEGILSDSDVTDFDHLVPSESDLPSDNDSDESWNDEVDAEPEAVSITDCFFCGQVNHEKENNIKHMFSKHGLYIPERSYLVDVSGLLSYISEAITLDHECLVCGFQGKNLESIRQHIYNKGHAKLPYENKEERLAVEEYYNFTIPEEVTPKKANKKKVAFMEENGSSDEEPLTPSDDEEEEFDEDSGSGINDNYTIVQIDKTGVELTLPSGSRIGHRSMARYYRQNLPLTRAPTEAEQTVAVVDKRFTALSLAERSLIAQEKAGRRVETQSRQKYEKKLKNVNAQRHFRDEILGT
ncbi:uncharacterized protein KQ657_004568 [Scheffersomyces spartinae]|uniref:C2H2-type domain-containing protein n=1 Tax=Scheffersomyces spartinae TaxID=45513 RepID=A0A9P8AJ39_9ASCO|nr:uncharacterized protein KQ657_004568 [Scheffersomyces spartinae]KAG7194356.1 hypothetical protein KQ657_004568 [Scheffersomyces spartinae]